eukprot:PhM_4_TR16788/c2_g1_i1/m.103422
MQTSPRIPSIKLPFKTTVLIIIITIIQSFFVNVANAITCTHQVSAPTSVQSDRTNAYKLRNGGCHRHYISVPRSQPNPKIRLFDSVHMLDVIDSSTYDIQEFGVDVSPDNCGFDTQPTGGVTQLGTGQYGRLTLTGVASIATYRSILETTSVIACIQSVPKLVLYEVIWGFTPALKQYPSDKVYDSSSSSPDIHFYEQVATVATWADAKAACEAKSLFGLKGYLVTLTSLGEAQFHAAQLFSGWIGVSDDGDEGFWTWRTGPESDEIIIFKNWDTNQPDNAGSGENFGYVGQDLKTGRWGDASGTATMPYTCEFGGTTSSSKKNYYGLVTLAVQETDCNFGERSRWMFPGSCNVLFHNQKAELTSTRLLFEDGAIPDLLPSTDTSANIRGFIMTVDPNLCEPFVLVTSNGITVVYNAFNRLELTGTTTVQNYMTVLRTIGIRTCRWISTVKDDYNILWELVPDMNTFLTEPSNEPHYYWQNAGAGVAGRTWASALTYCANLVVLGMKGYLATFTSLEEQLAAVAGFTASGAGSTYGWFSARGYTAESEWLWRSGPEEGRQTSATPWAAQWHTSEPAATDGAAVLGVSGYGNSWHAQDHAIDGVNFICEFGGMEGTYSIRGAIRLIVRTSKCDMSARERFATPGVCGVSFGVQGLGSSGSFPLLSTSTMPDLQNADAIDAIKVNISPETTCASFGYGTLPTGLTQTKNDGTGLLLSGTVQFIHLSSFLPTISVRTCPQSEELMDTRTYSWELVPSTASTAMLKSFTDVYTNEPHYYRATSLNTFVMSSYGCPSALFGLEPYLTSITTSAENVFVDSLNTNFQLWTGAFSPLRLNVFKWSVGPNTGGSIMAYTNWGTLQPDEPTGLVNGVTSKETKWSDTYADGDLQALIVCELGGMEANKISLGVVSSTVRTSPCLGSGSVHDVGFNVSHSVKGAASFGHTTQCFKLNEFIMGTTRSSTLLFTPENVPTLISTDPHNGVKSFYISVDPPLCRPLNITIETTSHFGISSNNLRGLTLSGVDSVESYVKAVRTIFLHTCATNNISNVRDAYSIIWEFVPDGILTISETNSDPHYYTEHSGFLSWVAAKQSCSQRSVFGVKGYLATVSTSAESEALRNANVSGWISLKYDHASWRWQSGPDTGSDTSGFSNWESTPTEWKMKNVAHIVLPSGKWRTANETTRTVQRYVCEYNGEESSSTFRGGFYVKFTRLTCDMSARKNFAYRGVCSSAELHQRAGTPMHKPVFSAATAPEMFTNVSSARIMIKGFHATFTTALCTPLTALDLSFGITVSQSTLTEFSLTGIAKLEEYQTILQKVIMTGCSYRVGRNDWSGVFWEIIPNLARHVDPVSLEPHYYEHVTAASPVTWEAARTLCSQRSLFGLKGYLATVTSASENALLLAENLFGWIGGADNSADNEWRWRSGPESFIKMLPYTNWAASEPNVPSPAHARIDVSGSWYDEGITATRSTFVCEFGGTEFVVAKEGSMAHFRGRIDLLIITHTGTPTTSETISDSPTSGQSSTVTLSKTATLSNIETATAATVTPTATDSLSASPTLPPTRSPTFSDSKTLSSSVSGTTSQTNTNTPSSTDSATNSGGTPSPTYTGGTQSNDPTRTASSTLTPSINTPSLSSTESPTDSRVLTPAQTRTGTDTHTPTSTPTVSGATVSDTHTAAATETKSDSNTMAPSQSPSASTSVTLPPTRTNTFSNTESNTHTPSGSASATRPPTASATFSDSAGTPTFSSSASGTRTRPPTATPTASHTSTFSVGTPTRTESTSPSTTQTPGTPSTTPSKRTSSPSSSASIGTPTMSTSRTVPPTRTRTFSNSKTHSPRQTISPSLLMTPSRSGSHTIPNSETKTDSHTATGGGTPTKSISAEPTKSLSLSDGTDSRLPTRTASFSTTWSTKGIILPSRATFTMTRTFIVTRSVTLQSTRTHMPKKPRGTLSSTLLVTDTATAYEHHVPEPPVKKTRTGTHTRTLGSGMTNAPTVPPPPTFAPETIMPLATLGPEAYNTTPAPASNSIVSTLQLSNAFLIRSSWVMDNSPILFGIFMSAMVLMVVSAWFYSRGRPPPVSMFVEPVEPRLSWPARYRHEGALRVLFPNPCSQAIPADLAGTLSMASMSQDGGCEIVNLNM